MTVERVSPMTLIATHVCEGEEVVTGGADGQVWVATFADAFEALKFIAYKRFNCSTAAGQRGNG
jgi:hypothetical protein